MPELIVFARLVKQSAAQYTVVVSTAPVDEDRSHTDVRIADAPSYAAALETRQRIVGEVVDRLLRRGDQVKQVRWMENVDATTDGA
jgi:hypothetical protein